MAGPVCCLSTAIQCTLRAVITTANRPQRAVITTANRPKRAVITTNRPQRAVITTTNRPQRAVITTANRPQRAVITTANRPQRAVITTNRPQRRVSPPSTSHSSFATTFHSWLCVVLNLLTIISAYFTLTFLGQTYLEGQ